MDPPVKPAGRGGKGSGFAPSAGLHDLGLYGADAHLEFMRPLVRPERGPPRR